jgi:hypothetical protein
MWKVMDEQKGLIDEAFTIIWWVIGCILIQIHLLVPKVADLATADCKIGCLNEPRER